MRMHGLDLMPLKHMLRGPLKAIPKYTRDRNTKREKHETIQLQFDLVKSLEWFD